MKLYLRNQNEECVCMKKRLLTILSIYLAACMLIAAVPAVTAAEKDDPMHGIVPLSGESYYPSFHSYGNLAYGHGHTVSDYLVQNSDSTLTALRPSGGQILIETYSSDGKALIKTQKLSKELSIFGGFYAGTKYNFLVFAQNNYSHNNSTEVFRVVKYSKDWNRLGAA